MKKLPIIIDVFISIVDNYGDMGFACELVSALRSEYREQYQYVIWTDNTQKMSQFAKKSLIGKAKIADIADFWILRKSLLGILLLHTTIPDLDLFESRALILRIDYVSLDPMWIIHNEIQHIASTRDRRIIELIPSPLEWWAGLIMPVVSLSSRTKLSEMTWSVSIQVSEHGLLRVSQWQGQQKHQKHITIFVYPSTLDRIDWESFPSDLIVYVCGKIISTKENIISLDWLDIPHFYTLLDTSEFVFIRWEVSWSHMIQGSVPFFWDMYQDIGGFSIDQSIQFLSIIGASPAYRDVHQILNWQKISKISYLDMVWALSHTRFTIFRIQNLIHTMKKHIDRFHNSI